MKNITPFVTLIFFILVISMLVFKQCKSYDDYATIKKKLPIDKILVEIITSPLPVGKKHIEITDRNELKRLDSLLKTKSKRINVQVAKSNDVLVYLHVYKGNQEIEIKILDSIYTGWILLIGNLSFYNEGIFDYIKNIIKKPGS